jgi:predicted DNA-binding protein (MmcQ/YjbR family)
MLDEQLVLDDCLRFLAASRLRHLSCREGTVISDLEQRFWGCSPMNAEALRDYCLSLEGASETFPFGPDVSVFKVSGKMFALSILDQAPLRVSLKSEPELAEQLRATHAAVLPGYHLNKRHWNTVIIDGSLSDQLIEDMIDDSYDLVVSAFSRRSGP